MRSYFSQSSKSPMKQALAICLFVMLLAPALALLLTSQSEVIVASPDTFGKTDIGEDAYEDGGRLMYSKYQCTSDGTADNITAYFTDYGAEAKAAIYWYDNLAFIAETGEIGDAGLSWQTFDFSVPKPSLVADTWYILALWTNDQTVFKYDAGSQGDGDLQVEEYNGFPSTLDSLANDYQFSIYCSFTPEAPMLPTQPSLYSPSDGSTTLDNTPDFEWENGENADNHRILIWYTDNIDYIDNEVVEDNTWSKTGDGYVNENYSWKVIAVNEGGENESDNWTFLVNVIYPTKPILISPDNDSTEWFDGTPTFSWTPGENTENHQLLVDNDSDFSSPEENHFIQMPTASYTIGDENALPNDNYYWKVIAINENGENSTLYWQFELLVMYERLGYQEIGTSYHDFSDYIMGSVFTMENTGRADNIMAYISIDPEGCVKAAIYKHSDNSLVAETEEKSWQEYKAFAWESFSFLDSKPVLYAAENYVLCVWSDAGTYARLKYITGDTNQGHIESLAYDGFPDPIDFGHNDRKYSIYVSYKAGVYPSVTTENATDVGIENATLNASIILGQWDNLDVRFVYKSDKNAYNEPENENWSLEDWYYSDIPIDPATSGDWASRTPVVVVAAFDSPPGENDYQCDGTDDQAEIQAAIDNIAAEEEGTVRLLAGNYYLGNTITFGDDDSNLSFIGAGMYDTIIHQTNTGIQTAWQINSNTDILIENLTFRGMGRTAPGEVNGMKVAPYNRLVMRNIYVHSFPAVGVYTEAVSVKNIWLLNSKIANTGAEGLAMHPYGPWKAAEFIDNYFADNNVFTQCGFGSTGYGRGVAIHIRGVKNFYFVNNIVENSGARAINISPEVGKKDAKNILIQGNYFANNSYVMEEDAPLRLGAGENLVYDVIVRGNLMKGLYGIDIDGENVENCTFDNNNFYNTARIYEDNEGTNIVNENYVPPRYVDSYYTDWQNTSIAAFSENVDNLYSDDIYGRRTVLYKAEIRYDSTEITGEWIEFASSHPENPLLLLPENSSILVDLTPTFEWISSGGFPYSTRLIVDNTSDFSTSFEIDVNVEHPAQIYTPTSELSSGENYWWKVIDNFLTFDDPKESGVFNFKIRFPPIIENLYMTDMDNAPTSNVNPKTSYKCWIKIQDNDFLSDIENIILKFYENTKDNLEHTNENIRNFYYFMWSKDDGFDEIGPDNEIPYAHLIVENCLAGDNTMTTDNWIFQIKLSGVTTPENWSIYVKVTDSTDTYDNENYSNKFSVNKHFELEQSTDTLKFGGYPGSTNNASYQNPVTLTITTNYNFNLMVRTSGDFTNENENLWFENSDGGPSRFKLTTSAQISYPNISWGEDIVRYEYYFIDIPIEIGPGKYSTDFYTEHEEV